MKSTLELRVASLSDVGLSRDQNEDACFAGEHVFAVADGLGGHSAGEVASAIALEPIEALDGLEPKRSASQLGDAVRKANRRVFERSQKDTSLKGMGTTLTAVVIDGAQASLCHVGDSRCYLIRKGRISQVSSDHTLVARMVEEGKLTAEQAESHPQRSILTRALGAERDVEIEELSFDIGPGDVLLLCSDGLTSVLNDDDILEIATQAAVPEDVVHELVAETNARGGPDNVTVVAVEVAGEGAAPRALGGGPSKAARRVPTRALVWSAVVLTVLVGGFVGMKVWSNSSWYVGIDGENVAIYQGLPVSAAGLKLSHVSEQTGVKAGSLPPGMRTRLADGIRATTLQDARRIVREQIVPNATSKPSPSPKASAGAKASPKASGT